MNVDGEFSGELRDFAANAVKNRLIFRRLKNVNNQIGRETGFIFLEPRVVIAGEPRRIPDVTNGFSGSCGMAFLLTVMPTE